MLLRARTYSIILNSDVPGSSIVTYDESSILNAGNVVPNTFTSNYHTKES